eukprot:11569763-Ditylum_brightwellii.AAC.1
MEVHTMQGIAVSCSSVSNGIMFYCPHTKHVYTTFSYCLDKSGHTVAAFNLRYDSVPEPYPLGTEVAYVHNNGVTIQGSVSS